MTVTTTPVSTARGLSSYWERLAVKADTLLEQKIAALAEKTIDPDWCLASADKRLMEDRQLELAFNREVREAISKGGVWGRVLALDTVCAYNPLLVFKV